MAAAIIFVMDHARAPRHRADRRVDAEFILVEIQIVDVVEDEPQIAGANIDVADIGLHAAEEIGFHRAASGILVQAGTPDAAIDRSEEHTSELQSLMRISYAVFCLKKKKKNKKKKRHNTTTKAQHTE